MVDSGDKSVLKCTIKKSVDVFRKVARYGLYFIIAGIIGAICLAIAITISAGLYSFMDGVVKLFNITISNVLSLIGSIPWYVYVGVIAILAIPVYSLIWCIAREFTEEDWNCWMSRESSSLFTFAIIIEVPFIVSVIICRAVVPQPTFVVFLIMLIAFFVGACSVCSSDTESKVEPNILGFIGAYLHYRKRMTGVKTGGVK
jgi:hypothetical protein